MRDRTASLERNIPFLFNARHLGRDVPAVSLTKEWVEARRPTVLVGVAEHYLTKKDRQRQGLLKPKVPVSLVKR